MPPNTNVHRAQKRAIRESLLRRIIKFLVGTGVLDGPFCIKTTFLEIRGLVVPDFLRQQKRALRSHRPSICIFGVPFYNPLLESS